MQTVMKMMTTMMMKRTIKMKIMMQRVAVMMTRMKRVAVMMTRTVKMVSVVKNQQRNGFERLFCVCRNTNYMQCDENSH
jgi:hypothetical protein